MPAPLHEDARIYLRNQGQPITSANLNKAMETLRNDSSLRPSYSSDTQMASNIGFVEEPDRSKIPPPPKGIGASGGNDAVMYDPMYNPRPNSAPDTKRGQRYSTNEQEFGQTGSDYSQTTPEKAKRVRDEAKRMADRDLRSGQGGTAQGATPGTTSQSVSTESVDNTTHDTAPIPKVTSTKVGVDSTKVGTDQTAGDYGQVANPPTPDPAKVNRPKPALGGKTEKARVDAEVASELAGNKPPPSTVGRPPPASAAPPPSAPAAPPVAPPVVPPATPGAPALASTDPMQELGQAFLRRASGANDRWAERLGGLFGGGDPNAAVAAPAPGPVAPPPIGYGNQPGAAVAAPVAATPPIAPPAQPGAFNQSFNNPANPIGAILDMFGIQAPDPTAGINSLKADIGARIADPLAPLPTPPRQMVDPLIAAQQGISGVAGQMGERGGQIIGDVMRPAMAAPYAPRPRLPGTGGMSLGDIQATRTGTNVENKGPPPKKPRRGSLGGRARANQGGGK